MHLRPVVVCPHFDSSVTPSHVLLGTRVRRTIGALQFVLGTQNKYENKSAPFPLKKYENMYAENYTAVTV